MVSVKDKIVSAVGHIVGDRTVCLGLEGDSGWSDALQMLD